MQIVTATDLARNFRTMLDSVEFRHEELLVMRNNHAVARVIPSPATMTAQEVFSDLYRLLPENAAKDWLADSRSDDIRCNEVSDPWES
jgi:PHD/YefM family antitoxin component YafN of YafNO toxin-antitoxin module